MRFPRKKTHDERVEFGAILVNGRDGAASGQVQQPRESSSHFPPSPTIGETRLPAKIQTWKSRPRVKETMTKNGRIFALRGLKCFAETPFRNFCILHKKAGILRHSVRHVRGATTNAVRRRYIDAAADLGGNAADWARRARG